MDKQNKNINILAISGSLREKSTNSTLLRACKILAPKNTTIKLYKNLGFLPLFNPDIEGEDYNNPAPNSVNEFRKKLKEADGIIIASPEYAHGITGAMKNALDWTVASGDFVGKPVVIFNTSPRASHALASLKEIISVIDAQLIESAFATVKILGSNYNESDIVADSEISKILSQALEQFTKEINKEKEKS